MKKERQKLTVEVLRRRIIERIALNEDGCWIWQEGIKRGGYAHLWDGQRSVAAHRVAFEVFRGAIPVGLLACHKCDVRRCVNPFHIFIGTQADNHADMHEKGRHEHGDRHWARRHPELLNPPRGEAQWNARLTEDMVREIRRSTEGGTAIANRLGLNRNHVYRIRRGERWAHVTG